MRPGEEEAMAHDGVSRRDFVRAAAAAAATALSYSRIVGANERVNLGLVGCGSRGIGVMKNFLKVGDVDVTALCDVYGARIELAKQSASRARAFNDHRKLLDAKDVDAVLIAVPDHWHLATTVDALLAGKDVYVEKPLTLKLEEGPAIVKAARINKRVCQVGMQQRSGRHYLQAKQEYFDTGKLGKLTLVRTWWHGNGFHLRRAPAELQKQPLDLDWARFLGPLAWRDYDAQQYYNWRAYLDYGGGQITDLFTHWIDVVHMFMGDDIPLAASAAGGVYHYSDGRTAPDTINVLLEYPSRFTATFEATLAPGITGSGIEFCGTEGRLLITRSRFEYYDVPPRQPSAPPAASATRAAAASETPAAPAPAPTPRPATAVVQASGSMDQDHVRNFLDCVVSRKLPSGDVLIGHRSAQASHLGNIAYLEKRRIRFDPAREQVLPT
jgi:predicted dehydrogenase